MCSTSTSQAVAVARISCSFKRRKSAGPAWPGCVSSSSQGENFKWRQEKTVEFPTCIKQPGFSVLLPKKSKYAWMHTWDSCLRSEKHSGRPLHLLTMEIPCCWRLIGERHLHSDFPHPKNCYLYVRCNLEFYVP